jgi:thiamine biosynthesis protein ThiI
MLKIADKLAQENEYYAIVKWDSLGQVSSQTLKNMFAIDRASETLVLRPLIWFNKQEIVNITKEIWTYDFACNMPEYCGVISDKPATWASLKKVIEAEKVFNESLLFEAFDNKKVEKVTDIIKNAQNHSDEIEIKNFAIDNDVIIDIRDPDTQSKKQLLVENREIISIPFYDINNKFSKLDQTKNYLLYCDKWVMSKLHWLYLLEKWFNNVALFQPIEADKTCWTL